MEHVKAFKSDVSFPSPINSKFSLTVPATARMYVVMRALLPTTYVRTRTRGRSWSMSRV